MVPTASLDVSPAWLAFGLGPERAAATTPARKMRSFF